MGSKRGAIVELLSYNFELDGIFRVENFRRIVGSNKKAKTVKYQFKTAAEATPDQIIQAWVDDGSIRITDMNFDDFAKRVIDAHEDEFERLYVAYIAKKLMPRFNLYG